MRKSDKKKYAMLSLTKAHIVLLSWKRVFQAEIINKINNILMGLHAPFVNTPLNSKLFLMRLISSSFNIRQHAVKCK